MEKRSVNVATMLKEDVGDVGDASLRFFVFPRFDFGMFFNEEKGVFFWRLPQLHISIVCFECCLLSYYDMITEK